MLILCHNLYMLINFAYHTRIIRSLHLILNIPVTFTTKCCRQQTCGRMVKKGPVRLKLLKVSQQPAAVFRFQDCFKINFLFDSWNESPTLGSGPL